MGGELVVNSQVGVGSTFTVRLFLANLGTESEQYKIEDITGYQGRRQKILVVDDQSDHRDLIRSILAPLGFIIEEASSGEDCLLKVEQLKPKLIILDLAMTGIDGTETTHQIRDRNLVMPIIILSANAYPSDRLVAMNSGANDFLAKPIQVPHLLNKLKLHLGLSWVFQTDNINISDSLLEEIMLRPTEEIIEKLQHFVRIGDLMGLNKHLDILVKNQPEYRPFILRVKVLIKEFRIAEIKKLLS